MMTRTLSGLWVAAAILVLAAPAEAQSVRGAADVQYRKVNTYGRAPELESWLTSFRIENSSRIGQSLEVWSQFRFSESRFTGRPERTRVPEGTVRLSHPIFGLQASYQPSESRDSRSLTSRRQDTSLSAYLLKPGLPALNASWTRGHLDARDGQPGSVVIRRSLSATKDVSRVGLRAGYADQSRDIGGNRVLAAGEKRLEAAATTHFEGRRWGTSFDYGFNQMRRNERDSLVDVTNTHTVTVGGTARFSPKTSAALNYTLLRTGGSRSRSPRLTDQNGALNVTRRLNPVFQAAVGTGIRNARLSGRDETERYLTGTLLADASVRTGWRLSASASQSLNWLPGQGSLPVTALQTRTTMQLAKDLELTGDVAFTSSRSQVVPGDTVSSPSHRTLQAGTGIRATPVRSLSLTANLQRYQSLGGLPGAKPVMTTYLTRFDWRITSRLQSSGTWIWTHRSGFMASDGRVVQARVQWNATSRLRASGAYAQTRQGYRDPSLAAPATRESFQGWIATTLGRHLSLRVQVDDVDPRRATHTREVSAALAQGFGR